MGILGQFGRILTNRLTKWGINKGIDAVARRGGTAPKGKSTPQGQKQAQQQAKSTREAVKRARKAAQLARRMSR